MFTPSCLSVLIRGYNAIIQADNTTLLALIDRYLIIIIIIITVLYITLSGILFIYVFFLIFKLIIQ